MTRNTTPAPYEVCGHIVPAGHLTVFLFRPNICHACDDGNCVVCEAAT